MHAAPVFVAVIISYAAAQQTFQSTVFDLPAELPAEDYAVLSQIDDVPKKEIKQITKPRKIDKGALHLPQVEPPTQPSPLEKPQSVSQPSNPITPVPFSLATYPTLPSPAPPMQFTIAPFSLPVNFTSPPSHFVLPTHPTLSPIILPSHPTLPPFTFPTHPTLPPLTAAPPPQLPMTGTAQFPQFQQIGSQPHVIQPPQQFQQFGSQPTAIQYPQQFQQFGSQPQAIQSPQQFQQFGPVHQAMQPPQQPHQGNPSLVQSPENYHQRNDAQIPFFQTQTEQPLYYQPAQSQSQVQQSTLQTKQQGQNAEQPQVLYGGFPQQEQPVYSQFPQPQQLVAQTAPQQRQQLRPLQQQYGERNYQQPNHLVQRPQSFGPTQSQTQQFAQPATPQFIGFQPNQQQQRYEQVFLKNSFHYFGK
uniref:Extensin-like n=1 Tax=Angiostrongylus cantonensis TaxID=6313 RepID=A0A0K0DG30_ANGCA